MKFKNFFSFYPWQLLTWLFNVKLTCRLEECFEIDIVRLQKEVLDIISKYNPVAQHGDDHAGGWKSVSLISYGGCSFESKIIIDKKPIKTEALKQAPYLEHIIDTFVTGKTRVRLMQLLPGETILWHYDANESIEKGIARIHIPVFTNDSVLFQISHVNNRWLPGEIWYGDFTFPHRLHNGSSDGRIHLVLDVKVNDKLLAMIPKGYLAKPLRKKIVQKVSARMANLYTWYRYSSGYMKRKQKNNTFY